MIALILAPSKGEAPYPPLAICSLKAWLKCNGFESTAIDLNRKYVLKHKELLNLINRYFGRPTTFLNTDSIENIYNLDTIYNIELLLKFMYYDEYSDSCMNEEEYTFYKKLHYQLQQEADSLINAGYKYIGFSTFVSNICYSVLLGQMIKKLNPEIKVFFGGCSTAYEPIRDFLLQSGVADYVLVGEGENAIVRLISDLEAKSSSYTTIYSANIAPDKLLENEIAVPVIESLDNLPFPDFSDLNLDNYVLDYAPHYRFVSIATSRGCVNRCAYCSETQYWRRYRQKSVVKVIEEIEFFYNKNKARIFFFCDSLINGNTSWLKDLCYRLIEKKIKIQWMSYVTLNNLDSELLCLMHQSGCVALTFGIEHINSKVLNGVNKTSSIGNTKLRLMECFNFGIFPIANIIYALPNETPEAFIDLLAFVSDPDICNNVLFTFRPYEIRVGSVTTNKLMQESEKFPHHNILIPQKRFLLKDLVYELAKYWMPNIYYVDSTKKKNIIISKLYGKYNKEYIWNVSNARRYNIPSILKNIVTLEACPKIINCTNESSAGFESFIVSLMDGKHNVYSIIENVEEYILQKSTFKYDMIHEKTSKYVVDNLIRISLKYNVIWN